MKVKLASFVKLAPPIDVTETRHIIGFVPYYRNFIANFSDIMRPLEGLTKKNTPFVWRQLCQANFDTIKIAQRVQFQSS